MLNLTHDWLRSFLPHVLTKIDRVSFGLLTPADLQRALEVIKTTTPNYDFVGVSVIDSCLLILSSEIEPVQDRCYC